MRVPDRQKQRREYLKKMAGAVGRSVGGLLVLKSLWIGTVICILMTCALLGYAVWTRDASIFVQSVACSLFVFVGTWEYRRLQRSVAWMERRDKSIAYVPPFTPDTLPADEVLVRGSQEPIQEQSSVLLRGAGEKNDKPEQLLRATLGNSE